MLTKDLDYYKSMFVNKAALSMEKLEDIQEAGLMLIEKVERYEKALTEIMDVGETYAATTDEHHSCAEGMYRYAEKALEESK